MWGVVNSNYAGINSSLINPANMLHSKLYLDVNLVTADVFFENTALYIPRGEYPSSFFLRSDPDMPEYGRDNLPFDYYRNEQRKDFHQNALVMGPSFSIARQNDAFGFRTAYRTMASGKFVPYEVVPFSYEGLGYEPLHNINFKDDLMHFSAMAWAEIAFSYARTLKRNGPHQWTGGITAKFLLGTAGSYIDMENIDYIVNNDSTLNLRNLRGEFGYAGLSEGGPLFSGKGFGVDLGVVYEYRSKSYSSNRSKKLCRTPYEDYKFRLGISLLDLGFINFNNGAEKHNYDDVSVFWLNIDTVNFRDIESFTRMLSDVFYGDPDASLRDNKIRMVLPAALSVQFDYHFMKQWYVNATAVQPVLNSKSYVYRPAQISLTPRYETQYLEFSLPISLYEYRYPRVGVAARFWFITVGTEKILGFLNVTDFTGMDFYVSLKFNFLKGKCRTKTYHCEGRPMRN
jgi:hypothetical protein